MIKKYISRAATLAVLVLVFSAGHTAFASTGNVTLKEAPQAPDSSISSTLSQNWAGYATSGGTYTGITGTWIVPTATTSSNLAADATWVGIGGLSTTDLIQAGTQSIIENGQQTYQAWYELLPDASTVVTLPIKPGDSITTNITKISASQWFIYIADTTTGQDFTTIVTYNSSENSAEWIQEMPSDESGAYVGLDDFGSVPFTDATAIVNGQSESLSATGAHALTMTTGTSVLAEPSAIGTDGQSFTVTRESGSASSGVTSQIIPIGRGDWRTGRGDQFPAAIQQQITQAFGSDPFTTIPGFSLSGFPSSLFSNGFPFDTSTTSDADASSSNSEGTSSNSGQPVTRTFTIPGFGTVTETTQTVSF